MGFEEEEKALVVNVCGRKPGLTCDRGDGRSGAIACLFEVELRAAPACKMADSSCEPYIPLLSS
jgi:hypothetical protein